MERTQLIKFYFNLLMSYNDILTALALSHRIVISRNRLLHILKDSRLSRRRGYADLSHVIDFILHNYRVPGKMLGYRWVLRNYLTGVSTANQRIESWWGKLQKEGMEYWIQLLGELWDG